MDMAVVEMGIIFVVILAIVVIVKSIPKYNIEEFNATVQNVIDSLDDNLTPIIVEDIHLTKGELVYFRCTGIEWYETRKIRQSSSYSGLNTRIRIMKGVTFNLGNVKLYPHTKDELTLIDTGTLIITNKKVLFLGRNSSKTIVLNKIVQNEVVFHPLNTYNTLVRGSGKDVILKMENNDDQRIIASIYIDYVLNKLFSNSN